MDRSIWAEKIKQKDGYKCVMCGGTESLQAHHIKPAFLYPECVYDIDNGATLCKSCHQAQHGKHFAGYKVFPVNGIDPDPENRMIEYAKKRSEEDMELKKYRASWATNKLNGRVLYEAAKAAGMTPKKYIAEAISMKIKADGFEHDKKIFVDPYGIENAEAIDK